MFRIIISFLRLLHSIAPAQSAFVKDGRIRITRPMVRFAQTLVLRKEWLTTKTAGPDATCQDFEILVQHALRQRRTTYQGYVIKYLSKLQVWHLKNHSEHPSNKSRRLACQCCYLDSGWIPREVLFGEKSETILENHYSRTPFKGKKFEGREKRKEINQILLKYPGYHSLYLYEQPLALPIL